MDISTSTKTLSYDSHYRIDIANVELASIMEELIDEHNKSKTTINRAIKAVVGSAYYDFFLPKTKFAQKVPHFQSKSTELSSPQAPKIEVSLPGRDPLPRNYGIAFVYRGAGVQWSSGTLHRNAQTAILLRARVQEFERGERRRL